MLYRVLYGEALQSPAPYPFEYHFDRKGTASCFCIPFAEKWLRSTPFLFFHNRHNIIMNKMGKQKSSFSCGDAAMRFVCLKCFMQRPF